MDAQRGNFPMCSEQIKCRKLACVVIQRLVDLPTG